MNPLRRAGIRKRGQFKFAHLVALDVWWNRPHWSSNTDSLLEWVGWERLCLRPVRVNVSVDLVRTSWISVEVDSTPRNSLPSQHTDSRKTCRSSNIHNCHWGTFIAEVRIERVSAILLIEPNRWRASGKGRRGCYGHSGYCSHCSTGREANAHGCELHVCNVICTVLRCWGLGQPVQLRVMPMMASASITT